MKFILKDVKELLPAKDFDYEKVEEEYQAIKQREDDQKIKDISDSLALLANLQFNRSI